MPRPRIESLPPDLFLPREFRLRDGRVGLIRRTLEDDAAEVCQMLPKTHAETDFLNYMPGEFQMTVEQEQEFIRDFGAGGLGLLILAQVDSRIVGIAGAASPRFQRLSHHAELGITVLAEFWGLTVGRALMQALLNWGRLRGLHKMYLRVFEENRRAIALYESLGFAAEARLRDDVRRADGSLGDTLIMSKFYVG